MHHQPVMAGGRQSKSGRKAERQPSRTGKKAVITYLAPEQHTRLKVLAAEQGTTLQALSEEAYRLLFNALSKKNEHAKDCR